jgi:murein peptide amidase A
VSRCGASRLVAVACIVSSLALGACGTDSGSGGADTSLSETLPSLVDVTTSLATTTVPSTTVVPSTITPTTIPSTTELTTTIPATTIPATIVPAPPVGTSAADDFLGEETIGYSAQGRPMVASHRGTPGGTVILVVGVIHGTENAGLAILQNLRTMQLPPNIDLWLLDAMNPDGLANNERHNGNGVDLNRNFPHDWTQVAQLGDWEYSGTGPASEPETQAFIAFTDRIAPHLTLWYHQDLNRISPSSRKDGPLRERYAALTGLPVLSVTGGTYTGVAATWVRTTVPDAMSFIVELGPSLSSDEAAVHAAAVLDIAAMAQNIA